MGTVVTNSGLRRAAEHGSSQPRLGQSAQASPWDEAEGAFTAWRSGDANGVDDLIRVMTPVLWHVVRAYRHDRAAAEDVVQAVWMIFVRSHASIADSRGVASWLITTARREALHLQRRSARTVAVEDEELGHRLPDVESAEAIAALDEESTRLWRAVGALDERCQKLVRVVAFSERPDYATLSTELSMPIGSIGPTRSRCLGKLRQAMTDPAPTTRSARR